MSKPSDVERMLAGLGIRNLKYREFSTANKAKAAMAWPLLRTGVLGPDAPAPPPPAHEQRLGARLMAAEAKSPRPAEPARPSAKPAPAPATSPALPPRAAAAPAVERQPSAPAAPLARRPLQAVLGRLAAAGKPTDGGSGGVRAVFKRLG
jgi:hypothetical protein